MTEELLRHAVRDVLPDSFDGWTKHSVRILGQTTFTARRTGVTIQVIQDAKGWWHLTKIHKGQVVAAKTTKRLPSDVTAVVFNALPTGRAA